jgi:hypothetical protein
VEHSRADRQRAQKLDQARADLANCVHQYSAALAGNLAVIDVSGDATPDPARVVQLWELTAQGATLRDSSVVQQGVFSFAGPLPARSALTVVTTGRADVTGADFRSAELSGADLGTKGTARVELVIGPMVTIAAADLNRAAAAAFPPSTYTIGIPNGQAVVSVASVSVTPDTAAMRLTVTGTMSATLSGLSIESNAPFSLSATAGFVPGTGPDASAVGDFVFGVGQFDMPGPLGSALGITKSVLAQQLQEIARTQLVAWASSALPAAFAHALALPSFPADTVVSIRQIKIDPAGLSFQAALSAMGTEMSTYHPPPIPAP